MARSSSFLVNWFQYAAARLITGFMHIFPEGENLETAASIGSMIYRSNKRRRARAMMNIARAYPEWSDEQVDDIAERSFQHMMQLFMVDAFVAPRLISPDGWPHYVRITDLSSVINRFLRGEPAILTTGHFGNWELLANLMASFGYPLHALARPIDNPLVNDWLMGIREARGTKVITKWGATPLVQQVIRGGGRLGVIADQNAGDRGMFVPFFGRLASTYKSIGLLAMRQDAPIHVGHARRIGRGFYFEVGLVDSIDPGDWVDQPDPLFYITARFTRAIENMVRIAPEQYLWVHRRWKSRPKHERDGEPVQSSLIRKLEQLPWMTQDELNRIVENSARDAAELAAQS